MCIKRVVYRKGEAVYYMHHAQALIVKRISKIYLLYNSGLFRSAATPYLFLSYDCATAETKMKQETLQKKLERETEAPLLHPTMCVHTHTL